RSTGRAVFSRFDYLLILRKLSGFRCTQEIVVQSHSHSSKIISLFVFAGLLASVVPALAQEPAATPADAPSAPAQDAPEEIDPNDPLFWSKTRDIFTVQKRPFQKEGRFAVSVYGGIIPNNIFEQYYPVGVRVNYY